jgi:hypothetical protein
MKRISAILAVTATALIVSAASATAASRVEVGVLECRGPTTSFIIGSQTDLRCVFRHNSGRVSHYRYRGTVNRLGVDIGVGQRTAIAWAVFAPTKRVGRGDLRGSYGGVSAGASVGIGGGANALLGGSNNTIALQPLSVQGQSGLGINAGIAGLSLI